LTHIFARAVVVLVLAVIGTRVEAQEYTVEVRPVLNDLAIKIEPVANTGVLVVNLTNNSSTKVRCALRYDAAPQVPYRTTEYVEPGKTVGSVFRAKRRWFSVVVDVTCEPTDK